MTDLSKKILEQYQVRKSKQQKQAFIDLLREHYPQLKLQEGGFLNSRNIIIGDVKSAKVLLTAHYDTCARLLMPNFITPKNILFVILYSILMILPIFIGVFLANVLLSLATDSFAAHYLVSILVYFGLMFLMLAGPANRHTANDNTSGVITLCELLAAISPQEQANIAFVFFDNEENGLLGSAFFRKCYKGQLNDKLVINFDCVSDGRYLMLGASKSVRKEYNRQLRACCTGDGKREFLFEKLECLYYPSDQAGFKNAIAVAALKRSPILGYYMDRIHTNTDTVFDEDNIRLLCRCTRQLQQQL